MKHSIFRQGPDQCIAHRGSLVPSETSEDPEHTTYFWNCCRDGTPSFVCRNFREPHDYGCRPSEYAAPPPPFTARRTPARRALSIDCEMGGVGRMSQLIQLVVLDYLTGEQLINTLVMAPRGLEINDFRTRYSGVTSAAYHAAIKNNTILRTGWQAARNALFRLMDGNTIIVGHNVKEDLRALRIAHDKIVDSQLLVQLAANLGAGVALKRILAEVVGREIQNRGRKGHDCHEDALAARDAVLWLIEKRGNTQQWLEKLKFDAEEKRRIQNERAMRLMKEEQEEKRRDQERRREVREREAMMVLEAVKPLGVWVGDGEGAWDVMQCNAAGRQWEDVEDVVMGLDGLAICV
ncbi:hypothetical protein EX30DRAFT_341363 [Ascodesmis nigricans]|uniref:Exonuclease domain-containing protein n=1 Tax=Ascodesmis nigricans TaxID=341454 RepID=A0A4S2MVT8_9PEZI|nr:hypothetical protein EX30DRAFT_341363 [Ascodesmis nigricans]